MQPYQEAAEELRNQGEAPVKFAKNVAKGAASLATKGALASRVLPLLSQYVPENLMIRGLSKIDPRLGRFIQTAQKNGEDIGDIRNFMQEKFNGEKSKQPDRRSIIEQHSPELHQFIRDEMAKGRTLEQAGAIARQNSSFSKVINRLEKEHRAPWSNILQNVFGGPEAVPTERTQEQQGEVPGGPAQGAGQGTSPTRQAMLQLLSEIKQYRAGRQ